jgi:phosphatidylserine/phosphatidylglycerophosphate/cardiolipin synthase-like enzyme
MPAIAIANDNAVFIAWSVPSKLPGCIGFTVHRLRANGTSEPLPAYVGFAGQTNPAWKARTTDEWPVQKFAWKDLFAPAGEELSYEIVALRGPSSAPQRLPGFQPLRTNEVVVTPERQGAKIWFNRGVISTQFTARALTGGKVVPPSPAVFLQRIAQESDPLRGRLAVGVPQALTSLLDRARTEGGTCHAALYELTDAQLLRALLATPHLQIVLSNANSGAKGESYDGENAAARAALREANKAPIDRFMPAGHIGHNKFVVYVAPSGQAKAVLTGSTNWTATGLCAQTNNAILVEDDELAARYLEFWHRLEADGRAAGAVPDEPAAANADLQGATLRQQNATPDPALERDGEAGRWSMRAFFSPNTKQRSKPKNGPTPVDLQQVFDLMHGAKQAILFLAFQPGSPSILSEIEAVAEDRKSRNLPPLLIRGAVTDPKAVGDLETALYHRDAIQDASVVGVQGIPAPFAYWNQEIYKAGHAVIHDKIVVIDPLDAEQCAVVTGSHNLGFRASYMNDENLLVIRGNRSVAEAYATHVMDVYDHFRWRWYLNQKGAAGKGTPEAARAWRPPSWQGLFESGDGWQDRYFQAGTLASYERQYFGGEAAPARAGGSADAEPTDRANRPAAPVPRQKVVGKPAARASARAAPRSLRRPRPSRPTTPHRPSGGARTKGRSSR